jgi:hypothetical protein
MNPQEQEEFLQRGRFGEGLPPPKLGRGALFGPAGVLLVLAACIGSFAVRWAHLEDSAGWIGLGLAAGSVFCAALGVLDRSGLASLIGAGALFATVGGAMLFLPAEPTGELGPGAGVTLLLGCPVCLLMGLFLIIVGIVLRRPR